MSETVGRIVSHDRVPTLVNKCLQLDTKMYDLCPFSNMFVSISVCLPKPDKILNLIFPFCNLLITINLQENTSILPLLTVSYLTGLLCSILCRLVLEIWAYTIRGFLDQSQVTYHSLVKFLGWIDEFPPHSIVLQIVPDPFIWIQFWRIRGK